MSENHTSTETCADRICRMLHFSPLPASFMWILLRRSLLCSLCDTYNPSTLSLSRARTRRLYPQHHVDTALQLQSKKQQTGPVITSRVLQSAKWYTHIHTLMLAQEHIQKHFLAFLLYQIVCRNVLAQHLLIQQQSQYSNNIKLRNRVVIAVSSGML